MLTLISTRSSHDYEQQLDDPHILTRKKEARTHNKHLHDDFHFGTTQYEHHHQHAGNPDHTHIHHWTAPPVQVDCLLRTRFTLKL
jgi:hypothetical protein